MLLNQVDLSGRVNDRLLLRMISWASGKRRRGRNTFRADLGHQVYFGASMGAWTQAAMRGPSAWSIGERELMASLVAKWNACLCCADVHSVVAATYVGKESVDAVLADYSSAPISAGLKATLAFLETMTLRPAELSEWDARSVLDSGVSEQSLADAIAVGTVFNLITKYVGALNFMIPTAHRLRRVADVLARSGYPL
jgi:AhpD family alkylhydroperoxidase